MKLYYSLGTCSLSPHIALIEADLAPASRLAPPAGTMARYRLMEWLMGDTCTVADTYLFTVASWGKFAGVDIAPLATLSACMARVAARPAVQAAMKAEGLIK